MAPGVRIELTIAESKSVVLPLHYPGINLVASDGFEPSTLALSRRCSPPELTGQFGGNEWTRTTNSFRMKEVDYHCPTLPYRNTLNKISQQTCLRGENVFLYGRGTENRTLICWLKASYFSR